MFLLIHHVLGIPKIFIQGDLGVVLVDKVMKVQGGVQIPKKTKHMNFLDGGKLHSKKWRDSQLTAADFKGWTIQGRVMIRQGHHGQAEGGAPLSKGPGTHIDVSAGTQAGMDVQVGTIRSIAHMDSPCLLLAL
jgi:phage terminase large subunit